MAMVRLEPSFRAPADCTVRLSHGGTDVDWTITAGDTWSSLSDMIAAWAAVLLAGFGGADPTVNLDQARRAVLITATGTWSVDWSHAGDGSAVAAVLGGTVSGDGDSGSANLGPLAMWQAGAVDVSGPVGVFGALVRATLEHRSERGHHHTLSGTHEVTTQHAYGDVPLLSLNAACDVWGTPSSVRRSLFTTLPAAIEAIIETGAGLGSLYAQADPETSPRRWVVRLADDVVQLQPERLSFRSSSIVYRVELPAWLVESAP